MRLGLGMGTIRMVLNYVRMDYEALLPRGSFPRGARGKKIGPGHPLDVQYVLCEAQRRPWDPDWLESFVRNLYWARPSVWCHGDCQ